MNRRRETLDLRTSGISFNAEVVIPWKSVYAVERRIRAELDCYRLWPDSNLALQEAAHDLFCEFRYLERSRGVDFFHSDGPWFIHFVEGGIVVSSRRVVDSDFIGISNIERY